MPFSGFNPFGITSFTSAPSSAEKIYSTIRASQGGETGIFRNNGFADTDAMCTALQLSSIYEDSNRAIEQQNPDTCTILLPWMEEQAAIPSDNSLTQAQRRAQLKVRTSKVPAADTTELLAYLQKAVPSGSVVSVSFPKLTGYPTVPPVTSNFTITPTPTVSYLRLSQGVAIGAGSTYFYVDLIAGDSPRASMTYYFVNFWDVVDSVVLTTAVPDVVYDTETTKAFFCQGTFTRDHSAGEVMTTMSLPLWSTGNCRCRVAITQAASLDARIMNTLRDCLERVLPVGTVYEFVRTPQDTTFTLDTDCLNLDRL